MPLLATVVIVFGVSGCGSANDPGPRFANEPPPSSEPKIRESVPPSPRAQIASPVASPIALAELLAPRGAPKRLYFMMSDALWSASPSLKHIQSVMVPKKGDDIRDVATSPNGDRAAVLIQTTSGGKPSASVLIVDAVGNVQQRVDGLEATLSASADAAKEIDWSPQGDQLLVAFSPGGLVSVPTGGNGKPIALTGQGEVPSLAAAAWSPTGEAVAFLSPSTAGQASGLYLLAIALKTSHPVVLVGSSNEGRSVSNLAWEPDGRTILFVQRTSLGQRTIADLWSIRSDGTGLRVVATAGMAAPVAQITTIAPSPDGAAVAYTVSVPNGDGTRFDSMWIRQLGATAPAARRLPVPEGRAVTNLWWTASGLVFGAVSEAAHPSEDASGEFSLYLVAPSGEATLFYVAPRSVAATPGTPRRPVPSQPRKQASPEGTPGPAPR